VRTCRALVAAASSPRVRLCLPGSSTRTAGPRLSAPPSVRGVESPCSSCAARGDAEGPDVCPDGCDCTVTKHGSHTLKSRCEDLYL
jgi:hypothetical protein